MSPSGASISDRAQSRYLPSASGAVMTRHHLPKGDRRSTTPPDLDPGVPVLLVRVGQYPIHHGTVGVIRTLGRAGVAVYAVTEEGVTPASTSRYLTGQVKLSSGGEADQSVLLDRLVEVVERLPARPLLICGDDEAAVLVAEGACALADRAICPAVPPDLPRQLAANVAPRRSVLRLGVPTPATWWVRTGQDLETLLGMCRSRSWRSRAIRGTRGPGLP